MWFHFGPFWSVKYLNFGEKLLRTARHTFLESRHPEGSQRKTTISLWTIFDTGCFWAIKTLSVKSLFFYVWQKRDFLVISGKTIYEDNITWTIPRLNFSFVDKRLKNSKSLCLDSTVLLYLKLWLYKVRSL